jgi:elongation factor Ts
MTITTAMVKELREATGAGILDCRKALEAAEGDYEKAVDFLREKGLAQDAKRKDRTAEDGLIHAYIHGGGRIGVLVEVNCETDFVARTDEFQTFVSDVAMQIAAMGPDYIARDDIPEDVLEREKALYRAQALEEGKTERIVDRIIEGRVEKFYQQVCLLEQAYIRDEDKTIEDLLNEHISRIGENIVIRRFARYQLGESLEG